MNINKNYNEFKREYRQYHEKLFDKCDSQKRPNLQIYVYRQSRIIPSKRYTKYFKYNCRKIFKYNQRIANIFTTGPKNHSPQNIHAHKRKRKVTRLRAQGIVTKELDRSGK